MNDLIELLTEGLTKLREDFNNLPNYEEQLSSITLQLNQLQENQLTKDNLKPTIDLLMSGYLATTKDEYLVMINALIEDIKTNNQTFLTNEIDNISNQVDTLIANAISSMKDDLNQFKTTIKNGKDGLNGINGVDGLDGKNGRDGLNGKDGKDGRDGINALSNGIKDIQLVNNELIITLDDNTIKTITMPTIKQAIGKVGGISKHSVQVMIDEALNSAVGSDSYTKDESDNLLDLKADKLNTYTKTETDTNIANAIDNLVNGASNILDSFGEVESVLGTLQTSINANSQAIDDLGTMSYTKSESDAKYQAKTDENLFIQDNLPTLATGKQALWIDTSNGDIQFNLVIGE